MQEMQLNQVFANIEQCLRAGELNRAQALVGPAVEQYPEISQLWFYLGCLFYKTGSCAVAREMFNRAIELDDAAVVYSNLGACLRRMNLHEEGINALQMALDRAPESREALVNMGAMFVNEGNPHLGIPYLERARALGAADGKMEAGTIWNLGLLYLEAGRFAEGFDCYREGVVAQREKRHFGTDTTHEPEWLTPDSPRKDKTLIVYGEQGIGDELMYGTLLEEARKDFGAVIFECHPRLLKIHEQAHKGLTIYPTRKDDHRPWTSNHTADYKAPIGDLCALYRRSTEAFVKHSGAGIYRFPGKDSATYRRNLQTLADGRPIVGLATRGGVMQTSRVYRTVRTKEIDRLMTETKALFVALDYEDILDLVTYVTDKYGDGRIVWYPSICQHYDYHHVAHFVQATDMVVTVCQSLAHLSAGLGHPTRVLTPKRCAWRYAKAPGLPDDHWVWYDHPKVRLYRQEHPDSWDGALDKAIADINGVKS